MAVRIFLISALLLLSAFGAHAARKITVIEDLPKGNVTRFNKAGKFIAVAIAAGDTFLSFSNLLNLKKKKVGTIAVNTLYSARARGINTLVAEWRTGSITAVGLFADGKPSQTFAIVGGTGAFVDAGGYVVETDVVSPDFKKLGAKYEFYLR